MKNKMRMVDNIFIFQREIKNTLFKALFVEFVLIDLKIPENCLLIKVYY
jgi:hypothetical protein